MMIQNKKIEQRIKSLRFNIEDINSNYEATLKDAYLECGIEYGKSYPYNDETFKLMRKVDELEMFRRDRLFSAILNFTQTLYSLKEYLRKVYPQKKDNIEAFFSNNELKVIARKDISNDLKHNPDKDLKYGIDIVGREIVIENNKQVEKIELKRTWFYSGIDSVDLCNHLFKDTLEFVEKSFS